MSVSCDILAVGFAAPGLESWQTAQQFLTQDGVVLDPQPLSKYVSERLPPNERRRMTMSTRLAFRVAEDCLASGRVNPDSATLFASYSNDLVTLDRLNRTISSKPGAISPTAFHNSVSNAPAGYWSIAGRSVQPSSTLSAGLGTVPVALVEATAWVVSEQAELMLVAYDDASPQVLRSERPVEAPFAWALALAPSADEALARLVLEPSDAPPTMLLGDTEALRCGNPMGRVLPLLQALARGEQKPVVLETEVGANWQAHLEFSRS